MPNPKPFPDLSQDQEDELKLNLQQWSLSNGLVMYQPNFQQYQVNVAPITIFPTPIPKSLFDKANNVQPLFNELYINLITKHKSFLVDILKRLSQFDLDFTGKLFEIYEKIKDDVKQPISLGIFRSDYMIDDDLHEIKQIEFNTVSVSFGGLSTKVGQLHKYLNDSGQYDNKYTSKYYDSDELTVSPSIEQIAQGLADGNHYYGGKNTTILFIVQPNERNCFDQRHIEYELFKTHGIKSVRLTLKQVADHLTIHDSNLYLKSTMEEISVIYYRAGYSPQDYEDEKNWQNRLFLEQSKAIKCPSILTQLSGSKKVQQLLTDEQVIKNILSDYKSLISTFVSIYPLDDSELGLQGKKFAFDKPEKYVLKPQREGGGNNIYKEDIPSFLNSIDEKEWAGYILMELINPQSFENKIIRNNDIYNESIISELGIFGTIVFNEDSGEILTNKNSGWLLRSKFETSDEGGVAAGFGCVDNVYLY